MDARRKHDADPKPDAESTMNAPAESDAGSRASELDQLFGQGGLASRSDAEIAASRERFAALFGPPQPHADSSEPPSDSIAADLDEFVAPHDQGSEKVDEAPAWVPPAAALAAVADEVGGAPEVALERARDEPVVLADDPGDAPDDEAVEGADEDSVVLADTGQMLALFGLDDSDDGLDADDLAAVVGPDDRADVLAQEDDTADGAAEVIPRDDPVDAPTAVIAPYDEDEVPQPVRAASALAPVAPPEDFAPEDRTEVFAPEDRDEFAPEDRTEVFAAPVASTAVLAPMTPVIVPPETSVDSTGSILRDRTRAASTGSNRVRWSVAASVVLLAAVVVGAIVFAQTLGTNNQATQDLAAATAELEAAEAATAQPYRLMQSAIAEYDDAVLGARAAADSAGPALASVAGMTDETALAAANAALAALNAQLDTTTLAAPPDPYARGDVDMTDLGALEAATQSASTHAERIAVATREAEAAQAVIIEKVTALTAAQVALGSSLPETAVIIVDENWRAQRTLRDAVIAAAAAVPAAQATGGWGDAELLAYAAAVTALRENQTDRAPDPVTPPSRDTDPAPVPEPDPVPPPNPDPTLPPVPTPDPTEPTDEDEDEG